VRKDVDEQRRDHSDKAPSAKATRPTWPADGRSPGVVQDGRRAVDGCRERPGELSFDGLAFR
jgi:hypothetical protein